MVLKNIQDARYFAMQNPGSTITRNPDGPGFVVKGANKYPGFYKKQEEDLKRQTNIKEGKPARSHFTWRDQEIARLLKFHHSGNEIQEMAIELERTPIAISAKLFNFGLITEEVHQKNMLAYKKYV